MLNIFLSLYNNKCKSIIMIRSSTREILRNSLVMLRQSDQEQKMVSTKLPHFVFVLKLQTLNITKNFHHNKRLNMS